MAIVLRTNGQGESYYKPDTRTVKAMIRRGILKCYSREFGYCNDSDETPSKFVFNGQIYKVEYFSGCFYPYLLKLQGKLHGYGETLELDGLWYGKTKYNQPAEYKQFNKTRKIADLSTQPNLMTAVEAEGYMDWA